MKNMKVKTMGCLLLGLLITVTVDAKNYRKKVKNAKGIEVIFQSSYKGKVSPGQMLMTVSGDQVSLRRVEEEDKEEKKDQEDGIAQPEKRDYLDYSQFKSYTWAELPNGKIISSETPFELGAGFTEVGEGEILGLDCKILRTSVRSNTIDVWFTKDIPFRGTPQASVGVPDGLVLKIVRNGDMVTEAVDIKPLKEKQTLLPSSWGEKMDAYDYQYEMPMS